MLFDDGTYKVINSKQNTTNLSSNNSSSENKSSESVQCSGTTKKGTRCKRMVKSANGRCYQH